MRKTVACDGLQSVAEHPVEADMREPDERERKSGRLDGESDEREHNRAHQRVCRVVGDRERTRSDLVGNECKIRRKETNEERRPRSTEMRVERKRNQQLKRTFDTQYPLEAGCGVSAFS